METKGLSVLTLRPDLSLQVALGEDVIDMNLDEGNAYALANMLAQSLRDRRANVGGESDLVVLAFDQSMAALATAQLLARPDIKVSAENQQLATKVLQQALVGLAVLVEQIQKEIYEQSKPH